MTTAASMPMYDLPECRDALDAWWHGLARHLRREGLNNVPAALVHDRPVAELWDDPKLWFSQCCGYDVVNGYAGTLRPLATPHFAAPECAGRDYASVIVVADDCVARDIADMRGTVCAVNGPESHSGMNAPLALVAPQSRDGRFFGRIVVSGAHVTSLEMIRNNEADVASIDCVTYALVRRYRPDALAGTRRIGVTERAPGVPYVAQASEPADSFARMQAGIVNAFADPDLAVVREALLLRDVELTEVGDYGAINALQADVAGRGMPHLA